MAQDIIEPPVSTDQRRDGASWWRAPHNQEPQMQDSTLNRFLGGSPAAVFMRLLFVSLIVGVFLMWLDIRPGEVIAAVERFIRRIWNLGFDSIREIVEYILAGAVIVLPIWLVIRLLNMRGAR